MWKALSSKCVNHQVSQMIKFDTETIRLFNIFETLTGVQAKDCLIKENIVYFLVDEEKIGLVVGRNGNVIRNVEKILNKNIKLFGYSDNLVKFVKNLIPKASNIKIFEENGKKIVEVNVEKTDKPLIIGREGKNLKILKELLKRNHKIDDLIVR